MSCLSSVIYHAFTRYFNFLAIILPDWYYVFFNLMLIFFNKRIYYRKLIYLLVIYNESSKF